MLSKKQEKTLETIDQHIFTMFNDEATGHDYYHIKRVVNTTSRLIVDDGVECYYLALLIAYFHDVFDDKINPTDNLDQSLRQVFKEWNLDLDGLEQDIIDGVAQIGYKNGEGIRHKTLAAQYVSDADMLDAMGAMGIARTFYYAGAKGKPFHDPRLEGTVVENMDDYRNKPRNSIDHFTEKLLLLRDWIISPSGQKMAEKRHQILLDYYNEFIEEVKI